MPRSARASSASTAPKKRTTKRNASKQAQSYEIPESPRSPSQDDQPRQAIESSSEAGDRPSPAKNQRGRSMSSTASTMVEDQDATPTLSKPSRKRTTSVELPNYPIPGFEALEAVNGLYQRLRDNQTEIERLSKENGRLVMQEQASSVMVETLQAELKTEKDKTKKAQQAQEKEAEATHHHAEKRLSEMVTCLQSFGSAALKIMPLLDVLTGAADIEYDDAAEKLYRIIKDQTTNAPASKAKQDVKD